MGAKLEGEVAVVDEGERAASLAAFEGLGLCAQLAEAAVSLGWKRPTEIQEQSIPRVLAGQDVIGIAQTGSGKTGAFALPILEDLLKSYAAGSSVTLFALVLSPTRELAMQIADTFEALGAGVAARAARLVGGMDMMAQTLVLSRRPHVVVGTPGRVVDHLTSTKGFSLHALRHLVLDEADRLLSMDFESEIDAVVRASPIERRTQLFSATMTTRVAKLQRACLR
ncbi:DEAD/DEAH box helicase, partial [Helicosporidium sp. ATCC 50920]